MGERQQKQTGYVVNRLDNVATALGDIEAGKVFLIGNGARVREMESLEAIPFGHKIATEDIPKGTAIMKYGAAIGTASRDIRRGEHVHLHNVRSNFDFRASTFDTVTADSTDMEYKVY